MTAVAAVVDRLAAADANLAELDAEHQRAHRAAADAKGEAADIRARAAEEVTAPARLLLAVVNQRLSRVRDVRAAAFAAASACADAAGEGGEGADADGELGDITGQAHTPDLPAVITTTAARLAAVDRVLTWADVVAGRVERAERNAEERVAQLLAEAWRARA